MYRPKRLTRSQSRKLQGLETFELKVRHSRNTRAKKQQDNDLARIKKMYQARLLNPNMTLDSKYIPKIRVKYSGSILWNGQRSSAYPTSFLKATKTHFQSQLNPLLPCKKCKKTGVPKEIDHKIPLFAYIDNYANKTDTDVVDGITWYGYSKKQIHTLYNDISNLEVICKSCNGSKGGIKNAGFYGPSTSQSKHVPYALKPAF